jgi:hypothetical protein
MLHKTSFVWLRFFRRKTYLWMIMAIALSKVFCPNRTEKSKEKVCLMMTLAKIDFVKIYAFMNDLLW